MRIVVVEDYPAIARSLERQLRSILGQRVTSVEIVADLDAAEAALRSSAADLLILDLNLGGDDGFELDDAAPVARGRLLLRGQEMIAVPVAAPANRE